MVVESSRLYPLRAALQRAWSESGKPYPLQFRRQTIGTIDAYLQAGDVVEVAPSFINNLAKRTFVDLLPLLKGRNFSLESFLPGVLDTFRQGAALRGLPLILGEFQLYANRKRLAGLGMPAPVRWTWSQITDALDRAAVATPTSSAALLAGLGWGDYRLWGGLLLGLGATLRSGDHLDLPGGVPQMKQLVEWARRYHWDPNPVTNPTNATWGDFYDKGFAGAAGSAVFAFLPSYLVYGGGPYPPGVDPLIFPLLPVRHVVPAWPSTGVGLSPYATSAERALDVVLWLWEPQQQSYFAAQGWPPATQGSATDQWAHVAADLPPSTPKFDAAGYLDVYAAITADRPSLEYPVAQAVAAACKRMYGGADVATEVSNLQQTLTASLK